MERVRTNLKYYREQAGINQQELAEITGISRKTISLLESIDGCNPRICTIYRLAKYFQVTVEELFPQMDEM